MPRIRSPRRPRPRRPNRRGKSLHPRTTAPMRAAPRCGAKTRAGPPCRAPCVRGKGRCRMHGGAAGSGAPAGNRNAYRHGFYAAAERARWRRLRLFAAECEGLLRVLGEGGGDGLAAAYVAALLGGPERGPEDGPEDGEGGRLLPHSYGAWGRPAKNHKGVTERLSKAERGLDPRRRGDDGGGERGQPSRAEGCATPDPCGPDAASRSGRVLPRSARPPTFLATQITPTKIGGHARVGTG